MKREALVYQDQSIIFANGIGIPFNGSPDNKLISTIDVSYMTTDQFNDCLNNPQNYQVITSEDGTQTIEPVVTDTETVTGTSSIVEPVI
jgi:hypothetical protein